MAFPDGWTKRWPININADSVTTGLVSDWPCLVTDQHFPAAAWANLQATGADLRFSSDEAGLTELYYDTPRLDVAGQKAHLYVRVPSLLASEDTVIYGWCGNASATAPSAAWMQNTYHADIVAWWPMEEGTGTTVGDRTSNANDGTMTNMDPATDWGQDANGDWYINFPGTNDYVGFPRSAVNAAQNALTVALRCRLDSGTATYQFVWSAEDSYSLAERHSLIAIDSSEIIRYSVGNGVGSTSAVGSAITPGDGAWHDAVLTWDDATDDIFGYLDGANDASDTQAGPLYEMDTRYPRIGMRADSSYPLYGAVGHASLWSTALSSDEIACHHLMLSDPATWATAGALESTGAGGPYLYHGRALGRIGPSMAGVR